jgi:integrase/recombinase XerD
MPSQRDNTHRNVRCGACWKQAEPGRVAGRTSEIVLATDVPVPVRLLDAKAGTPVAGQPAVASADKSDPQAPSSCTGTPAGGRDQLGPKGCWRCDVSSRSCAVDPAGMKESRPEHEIRRAVLTAPTSGLHGNASSGAVVLAAAPLTSVDADDSWALSDEIAARFLLSKGKSTRVAYAKDLRDYAEFCRQRAITPVRARLADIELYARTLEDGRALAPATVARRLSALSGFYRRAVRDEVLPRSPMADVDRPQVPENAQTLGLDRAEVQALLDGARCHSSRAHLLVALLVFNGLRISEALGTAVADLSVERGHQVVRIRRKGGSRATVPLAAPVTEALRLCLGSRSDGPLLMTRTGRPLDRSGAARLLTRVAKASLPSRHDVHPHLLRHAWVTLALDAGVSLRDVQDAAGHADPRTTRRYDRARHSLDRHPTYQLATYLEGGIPVG